MHTKLQAPTASLPDATKGQVEEALAALRAIIYAVEAYFEDNTVLYEQVLMTGNGDNLIARLHDARTYREQKRTF